jgi:hypothetical protein
MRDVRDHHNTMGQIWISELPKETYNSPDIFQEKVSTSIAGLEFVHTYIDVLLITTIYLGWHDHLQYLSLWLLQAGLKVNARKSFFGRSELQYLGSWITQRGIQPLSKKVEATKMSLLLTVRGDTMIIHY